MNIQNNIGIWISSYDDLAKVSKVIESIKKSNQEIEDVFLISDIDIVSPDYTVVPSFYVCFYNFICTFLSVKDLIDNKDKLQSQNLILLTNLDDIINSGINRQSLSNVRILEL